MDIGVRPDSVTRLRRCVKERSLLNSPTAALRAFIGPLLGLAEPTNLAGVEDHDRRDSAAVARARTLDDALLAEAFVSTYVSRTSGIAGKPRRYPPAALDRFRHELTAQPARCLNALSGRLYWFAIEPGQNWRRLESLRDEVDTEGQLPDELRNRRDALQ